MAGQHPIGVLEVSEPRVFVYRLVKGGTLDKEDTEARLDEPGRKAPEFRLLDSARKGNPFVLSPKNFRRIDSRLAQVVTEKAPRFPVERLLRRLVPVGLAGIAAGAGQRIGLTRRKAIAPRQREENLSGGELILKGVQLFN